MLKFVTKKMYMDAVNNGAEKNLRKGVFPWHLKSVQDAIIMNIIKDCKGMLIGEVGGGDTRILPALAKLNKVYNIEKFQGADGGPDNELTFKDVNNIQCWVGDSKGQIRDSFFDILFSVSVVEHVPTNALSGFIEDCARILKPGGQMFHAVDLYLTQPDYKFNGVHYTHVGHTKIQAYQEAFKSGLFEPLGKIEINNKEDLEFKPQYISNPDNIMTQWNKVAPKLADLRDNAQSVTLLWAGRKP